MARPEWEPTGYGALIWKERYPLGDESYRQGAERLGRAMAAPEEHDEPLWTERFTEMIGTGLFMPGGQFWRGAGRPIQQLLNCYVGSVGDSREDWGQSLKDLVVASGMGGGIGMNYSSIRGRGYELHGVGGEATGAVSLMRMHNSVGHELRQHSFHRVALMMALNIDHPDINEFIGAKQGEHALTNANMSVVFPDHLSPETFAMYVRHGMDFPLRWGEGLDELGREINARWFWERLIAHALATGEPGMLNQALAQAMHGMRHLYPLTSTNPCGEIWLPEFGSCDLGHLVLPRFVIPGDTEHPSLNGWHERIDWSLLGQTVEWGVRFLDNAIDVNDYPSESFAAMGQGERRLGLGPIGLHSMLMELGAAYSSPVAREIVSEVFDFIANRAYLASVGLAVEKGVFPFHDKGYGSPYHHKLWRQTRGAIREHGVRNVALLTVAPTGTGALVQGYSHGIEPDLAPAFIRRRTVAQTEEGRTTEETLVVTDGWLDHKEIAEGAYDIPVSKHLEMQALVQTYIDNSVSKTINISKLAAGTGIGDTILKALPYLKGVTLYQEGSRENEPVVPIRRTQIEQRIKTWEGDIAYGSSEAFECAGGVCEL